jgi:hypothetical protein
MPYLLASALSMTLFFGVYWLFLRRLSFPTANRAYLLAALGASLLVPLVEVPGWLSDWLAPIPETAPAARPETAPTDNWGTAPQLDAAPVPAPEPAFDWTAALGTALALGALVAAGRLGWSLFRLARLLRQPAAYHDGLRVVPTAGGNASFFHHVLLNDAALTPAERAQVLAHEAEHARRYHSMDRLAVELLLIPFWWNPVLYAYRAALVEVHEWEVDEALTRCLDRRSYAALLLKLHTAPLPLANLLGRRPLRTRIERILQPQTSAAVKKTLFLLALPVGVGALLAFGKPYTPDFAASADSVAPSDSIRLYESTRWGPKPLVIIDGKRYSSTTLTRIDPEKMSGNGMFPANNPTAIKRFGPEAKDGVLDLTTKKKDGVYTFDNDRDYRISVENIKKERSIPKDQFFAKYTLTDRKTGKPLERIRIQDKRGGGMSNDRKPDQKVYYLLDKKLLTEEQVATLPPETIARINTRGTGEIEHYSEEWRKRFEPGSILMWMSTTGEQLETDLPRPPRPSKPDPAPAPPTPDPPAPATPPTPEPPQAAGREPGTDQFAPMPVVQDWNTFHNSRGNQTIAQNGCRIQKFKRLSRPKGEEAILMVLSFDVKTHQISKSEYERFRQEFIKMGYEADILELKSDPKTQQYESARASLKDVKTGKSVTTTVNLRNDFTMNGQPMQAKVTGIGFFITVDGDLQIHARMNELRAVLTMTSVASSKFASVPQAVPVPAPTPQPDERPGVLERTAYTCRLYLSLEKYSPAFLERARQFFKEDGATLEVTNERLDAEGKLISVTISLRKGIPGKESSAVMQVGEKEPKQGWVFFEVDRRDNDMGCGKLPTPPAQSKPIIPVGWRLEPEPIWALLRPKNC